MNWYLSTAAWLSGCPKLRPWRLRPPEFVDHRILGGGQVDGINHDPPWDELPLIAEMSEPIMSDHASFANTLPSEIIRALTCGDLMLLGSEGRCLMRAHPNDCPSK